METACLYNADAIVFEHLDIAGRKRGSKKQRLHLWRAREVQRIVACKAHRSKMRISRVNAWNTSRLAFDDSGRVSRGQEAELNTYSLCRFSNGKIYNCDLNASYNIGARYFIRELLKPCRKRQGWTFWLKSQNVPKTWHRKQTRRSAARGAVMPTADSIISRWAPQGRKMRQR